MITLRRATERHRVERRKHTVWLTFSQQDPTDPLAAGFGALEMFNEDPLPPGAAIVLHPHRGAEIVTYVREGALEHEDSTGRSGVIRAGEFQRMFARHGIRRRETNASRTEWAHVFHIWLRTAHAGREVSHEQKRFCAAERRGVLCIVASRDGRRGSLHLHQDTLIYSALLEAGQHVVHELLLGRSAWLHVVLGDAALGEVALITGDSAGVTAGRAVSLTARERSEILLLDLGDPVSIPANKQVPHEQCTIFPSGCRAVSTSHNRRECRPRDLARFDGGYEHPHADERLACGLG